MNKMVVAVFDSETGAFEGLTALKNLHEDGSISLYASSVISKDEEGKVEVKQSADDGPIGTSIGFLTGSMIGMLGGPVGLAVGAGVGTMTGAIIDLNKSGIDVEFANDVTSALVPGKCAVLADIEESWVTPLDTRMEELGAEVFRRNRSEVIDEQMVRESDEMKAEWKELKEEYKEANDETKASIKKQMDKLKGKMEGLQEASKERLKSNKSEMEAKVSKLKSQSKRASAKRQLKLEKKMQELRDEYSLKEERLGEMNAQMSDFWIMM